MTGVTEVYTVPTFPHGNRNLRGAEDQKSSKP